MTAVMTPMVAIEIAKRDANSPVDGSTDKTADYEGTKPILEGRPEKSEHRTDHRCNTEVGPHDLHRAEAMPGDYFEACSAGLMERRSATGQILRRPPASAASKVVSYTSPRKRERGVSEQGACSSTRILCSQRDRWPHTKTRNSNRGLCR